MSFLCATNAECTSCSCSPQYCCLPQLTEIKEYEADWFHDTDHRRPEQLFPPINWSFSGKQIFRASTDWYWLVRTVCYPTTTNRDSVTNIPHSRCQTKTLIYEHIHPTQDTVVREQETTELSLIAVVLFSWSPWLSYPVLMPRKLSEMDYFPHWFPGMARALTAEWLWLWCQSWSDSRIVNM